MPRCALFFVVVVGGDMLAGDRMGALRLTLDGVGERDQRHQPKASRAPSRFIGTHFFSPVEKMPLLEVIVGKQTGNGTLARVLAFGTQIVVNDGYGFYTTRLFASYILEGCQLVAEGPAPDPARRMGVRYPEPGDRRARCPP